MAVQLSSSYLHRSFQLLAQLDPKTMTDDQAFERASNIVYEWAKQKFCGIFRQMPYNKAEFEYRRDGNEIGIIYEPESGRFIFRGAHPDVNVPGRMWITDIQISKHNSKYQFAVRLSVTSLQNCTADVPYSCPSFIQRIVNNIGLSDVVQIADTPHFVSTLDDVKAFTSFLENPNRKMPVMLLSPCYSGDNAVCNGYMADGIQIAKRLRGVAHVFCTTVEANDYLRECIGDQWAPYNGAIRTYYPNLSFSELDLFQHPLLTPQNIQSRRIKDEGESDAWIHDIENCIRRYAVSRRIPWQDSEISFYLFAHQEKLIEQRKVNAQSEEELVELYEEQIKQMQQQYDESMAIADTYAKDCEIVTEENDALRQLNNRLKAQIEVLRSTFEAVTGEQAEQVIPIGNSYAEMAEWVEKYYSDRLQLHSRAVRSLKKACYEDVELVYKSLKLLATSYHDYRMGFITYAEFKVACKNVDPGLDEAGAITDVAAGMEKETYYVQYCGKRKKLDRHLTKGDDKDRRYCLRIYFFWDNENQLVVVGDLPHHLDTSAT